MTREQNAALQETLAAAIRQNRNADPHQAAVYLVYALAKAGFRIIPKGR